MTELVQKETQKNSLPHGWAIGTIEDLIAADGVFSDGDWVESKDQDPGGDVRLTQLADVGDGTFRDKSSRFLTSDKAQQLGCTFLCAGDLLVARMPDPLGRACIFPGDRRKSVTVVDVCVVRAGTADIDHSWLMHFINSPAFRLEVAALQSGSTRKRISRKNLAKIELPVPPSREQRRIVEKIEELFTKLDAGVRSLEQVQAQLKSYRRSVLKAAVEGELSREWREAHKDEVEPASELLERILQERREKFVGKKYKEPISPGTSELPALPEGWAWATLRQLGELNRGKSKHRPRNASFLYGGPFPFVQTGDIREAEGTIRSYRQSYTEEGLKQSRLWPEGTLCITIAANIAETALLGFDACFPDSVVDFLPEADHCSVAFVEYFMRTARERLDRYAPATAQKNINLQTLNGVAVPLPPPQEQHVIVDQLDRSLSIVAVLEATIEASIKQADALRQSILKRAFSGELVPQDPDDEPASVLLERIREERQVKKQKPGRGRRGKTVSTKRGHAEQGGLF